MNIRILSLIGVVAAATYVTPSRAVVCLNSDITPTALQCAGRYSGNVLNNNAANITIQKNALAALGYNWNGVGFGSLPNLSNLGSASTIDFPGMLHGITFVGIHVGGKGGGSTSFYKFDAGAALDVFSINLPKSSAAVLYFTSPAPAPAPEPSSWALMVGGFGAIGGALRSRRKAEAVFL